MANTNAGEIQQCVCVGMFEALQKSQTNNITLIVFNIEVECSIHKALK